MTHARFATIAFALGAVLACGTTPSATPVDAGNGAADAGDASIANDGGDGGAERPILPYPPGPYAGGVGDVMPDFTIQGFPLSRTQRDSSKLPFRDIRMAEVRSDPACDCMVVVFNAVGSNCQPCFTLDAALTRAMDRDPRLCGAEAIFLNYNTLNDPTGNDPYLQPPTRADIVDFTQFGRQSYPVGLMTKSAVLALSGPAQNAFPTSFVIRPSDMKILGMLLGNGVEVGADARKLCNAPHAPYEKIATGLRPRKLAVDATHAYLGDESNRILRVPLGGGAVETLATTTGTPDALVLGATDVYWATHDGAESFEIAHAPKTGGAKTVLTSGTDGYTSLALDATDAYFTRSDGVVGRVSLSGGAVTTLALREIYPASIEVDDETVYWARNSLNDIMRLPKSGGTPTLLIGPRLLSATVNPLLRIEALKVRGSDLYFMMVVLPPQKGGIVAKLPKTGGPLVEGAGYGTSPVGFVFDPVDPALWTVTRDPRTGTGMVQSENIPFSSKKPAPAVMTAGQMNATAIASDGTYVYWTTIDDGEGSGSLRRMKP